MYGQGKAFSQRASVTFTYLVTNNRLPLTALSSPTISGDVGNAAMLAPGESVELVCPPRPAQPAWLTPAKRTA